MYLGQVPSNYVEECEPDADDGDSPSIPVCRVLPSALACSMQEGECKQEDGGSAQAGVLCADLPGWRVVCMRARDHSAMTRNCYMFTCCALRARMRGFPTQASPASTVTFWDDSQSPSRKGVSSSADTMDPGAAADTFAGVASGTASQPGCARPVWTHEDAVQAGLTNRGLASLGEDGRKSACPPLCVFGWPRIPSPPPL